MIYCLIWFFLFHLENRGCIFQKGFTQFSFQNLFLYISKTCNSFTSTGFLNNHNSNLRESNYLSHQWRASHVRDLRLKSAYLVFAVVVNANATIIIATIVANSIVLLLPTLLFCCYCQLTSFVYVIYVLQSE